MFNAIGPAILTNTTRSRRRVLRPSTVWAAALTACVLNPGSASAVCRPAGPPMTTDMVAAFVALPNSLLLADATTARGAAELVITVSQYVAADPAALAAVVTLLPQASVGQRVAIGQGLYRAFDVCTAADPAVAARIAAAARKINDPSVTRAYRLAEVVATGASSSGGPALGTTATPTTPTSLIGDIADEPASLKLNNPFVLPEIH